MNLLPFVFTFLLLLTFLNSFMFNSAFRTIREKEVILTEHRSYLSLLSKQNKDRFGKKRPSKEKQTPPPPRTPPDPNDEEEDDRQARFANKTGQDYRDVQMGCEGSKINLWLLIHGQNTQLREALQKTLARLIQILYEPYSFYKTSNKRDIAQEIIKAMIDQKIESFERLQFSDLELDAVYYAMIKGTNTGYPPLTEYCRLEKDSTPPIRFRFASKPVIRAAIGEELSQKVFSLEKKNHAQNKRFHALTQEQLLDLARKYPTSGVSDSLLKDLFFFKNEGKGLPQISLEKRVKIRAFHEAKEEKNAK